MATDERHLTARSVSSGFMAPPPPQTSARDRRAALYSLSMGMDIAALVIGYLCAIQIRDERWLASGGQSIIVLAIPIFIMIAIAREAQSAETLRDRLLGMQRSLGSLLATAVVIIGLAFLFDTAERVSRLGLTLTFGAAAVFIVLSKFLLDRIVKKVMGDSVFATVLILDGLNAHPDGPATVIDVRQLGLWPNLDRPEMMDTLSRMIEPYDRAVIACEYDRRDVWATFLKGHDVGGEILLDRDVLLGAVAIGEYDDRDTIVLSHGPLNLVNRIKKRTLDVIVASCALIALSPLLLVTALAIRLDSPGPIMFRQVRVGQGNRHFRIYKFRSMRHDNGDAAGTRSTGRDDDRITRVGRFIRRTSVDELPQILNVLRGDMSMVGPRPHALGSTAGNALFWHASEYYWLRHALKPGITGLAQIRGFRGATEQIEDLERRVRCDLEYLADWSLWSDIKILLKTARVVTHKNAY